MYEKSNNVCSEYDSMYVHTYACWCLFWGAVQSKTFIADDTFSAPPPLLTWIKLSQASCAAWSQSGFHGQTSSQATAPAERASLCTSSLPLISRGQRRAVPRLSLMPTFVWMGWVWASCQGGFILEARGQCMHVWVVLSLLCTVVVTVACCCDCVSLDGTVGESPWLFLSMASIEAALLEIRELRPSSAPQNTDKTSCEPQCQGPSSTVYFPRLYSKD